ncbi:unnamed protein product, partial [Ceratitis capitata]
METATHFYKCKDIIVVVISAQNQRVKADQKLFSSTAKYTSHFHHLHKHINHMEQRQHIKH